MDIDHDSETPGKKGVKDSQKLSFGAPFFRVEEVGLAVFFGGISGSPIRTVFLLKELEHHIKQGFPPKKKRRVKVVNYESKR